MPCHLRQRHDQPTLDPKKARERLHVLSRKVMAQSDALREKAVRWGTASGKELHDKKDEAEGIRAALAALRPQYLVGQSDKTRAGAIAMTPEKGLSIRLTGGSPTRSSHATKRWARVQSRLAVESAVNMWRSEKLLAITDPHAQLGVGAHVLHPKHGRGVCQYVFSDFERRGKPFEITFDSGEVHQYNEASARKMRLVRSLRTPSPVDESPPARLSVLRTLGILDVRLPGVSDSGVRPETPLTATTPLSGHAPPRLLCTDPGPRRPSQIQQAMTPILRYAPDPPHAP
jgi:hypothetical protein